MSILDALLAKDGRTRSDLERGKGVLASMMQAEGIHDSDDLTRIRSLPRRADADELVDVMTRALALHGGVRLRVPQATALRELFEVRGLFAPMRVGSGKTLVTLLAPTLLGSERPVLMLPASLRNKTRREFAVYARDWKVRLPRLVSYQEMGRPDREFRLLEPGYRPDLLLLDEAHWLRNTDSAVTRRVKRAIELLHPVVGVLSGTLITDKLLDYWHLARWALGPAAPVPDSESEAGRWGQAIDRDVGMLKRLGLGALESLPGGFHAWFRGSRGVVPTPGRDCDAAIEISWWRPELPEFLLRTILEVQESGIRPDGELLDEFELPDVLCQLALGFYYVWSPMPPDWWLVPRRAWLQYVRDVLAEHLVGFDSPSMVAVALDQMRRGNRAPLPPHAQQGAAFQAAWREVKDRFTPNPVPVWLSLEPLEQAARCEPGTLLWTRYRASGYALERMGIPYYPGGTDPEGAKPGSTIALSIASHGTGRNLQAWHRARVLTPPANADAWEQMIGREHREGQKSDTVYVEVPGIIDYHHDVIDRVLTQARNTSNASGFSMKLVDATWV